MHRHVRRVVVDGFMLDVDEPEAGGGDQAKSQWTLEDEWGLESDDEEGGDGDGDFRNVEFSATKQPALTPKHKQAQHDAWLPFALFLARLPALTDLIYACTHQMPACVLQALHTHHPKSRLHIRAFSLRSLYRSWDEKRDPIDPDDIRGINLNLEAMEAMVYGWAPGLRRVSLEYDATWFRLPRSRGGPDEVAMYRALGRLPRLPRLRRLRLILDCSPPSEVAESGAESRADAICTALANAAADAALALAIFNEIAGTPDAPLEFLWLEIDTEVAGESAPSLAWLLDWVGQRVVCFRDAPGGAP
ncbi:hypothetical protein C8A05DRAFT_33266 [Staphylotrichum tortipilum]|uniref:Uncharacterized protein n=1 Tax=Staphylotrichum tortipilum TaxID=2831512 RepID=A0AAN6RUX8_9PEZI|nr:hypothetical protein C8A05DRAFT_33266 [Staphylotrichum longicolle]